MDKQAFLDKLRAALPSAVTKAKIGAKQRVKFIHSHPGGFKAGVKEWDQNHARGLGDVKNVSFTKRSSVDNTVPNGQENTTGSSLFRSDVLAQYSARWKDNLNKIAPNTLNRRQAAPENDGAEKQAAIYLRPGGKEKYINKFVSRLNKDHNKSFMDFVVGSVKKPTFSDGAKYKVQELRASSAYRRLQNRNS